MMWFFQRRGRRLYCDKHDLIEREFIVFLTLLGAAASRATCGVDSLDAEGANFTAMPYCELVVTESCYIPRDLSYRSVGLFPKRTFSCQMHLALWLLGRDRVPGPSASVRGV